MRNGKLVASVVVSGAAIASLVGGVGVVQAAQQGGQQAAARGSDGGCVVYTGPESEPRCFATNHAARKAKRGWEMVFYEDKNFHGRKLWVQVAGNKCKGKDQVLDGHLSDLRLVPDKGKNFNNRISSMQTRHHCQAKLFGRSIWKGQKTKWLKDVRDLSRVKTNWSDAATSISFR